MFFVWVEWGYEVCVSFIYMYVFLVVSFSLYGYRGLSSVFEIRLMENYQVGVSVFASPSPVKNKNSRPASTLFSSSNLNGG